MSEESIEEDYSFNPFEKGLQFTFRNCNPLDDGIVFIIGNYKYNYYNIGRFTSRWFKDDYELENTNYILGAVLIGKCISYLFPLILKKFENNMLKRYKTISENTVAKYNKAQSVIGKYDNKNYINSHKNIIISTLTSNNNLMEEVLNAYDDICLEEYQRAVSVAEMAIRDMGDTEIERLYKLFT